MRHSVFAGLVLLLLLLAAMPARADERRAALAGSDLFAGIPGEAAADLAALSTLRQATAGEVLIRQGEANHRVVVFASGRAEVVVGGKTVAAIGPGVATGEISILDGKPATADVVMAEAGAVVEIGAEALHRYLDANPAVGYRVMENLALKIVGYLRR